MSDYRIEKDSMGDIKVPVDALYGAQTQRANDNFPISGIRFNRDFIEALGYVKKAAALANNSLGLIDDDKAEAIQSAAQEVIDGEHDRQFVIDIFQTGSGTSSNMNANEVISHIANVEKEGDARIHPNDHVNFGQSSNDVIPTAIRISAVLAATKNLIPALNHLKDTFLSKGAEYAHVVKTGRTHLMDAMPVTVEQEFGGYARQLELGIARVESALERVRELPQGGTAVGTGINTHGEFGSRFAEQVSNLTGESFREAENHFEAQATVDAPVELSAQLKTIAVSMMKMSNDLRWMNSGPNSSLGEIQLAALQPGSSIMPGKVNPVIEESVNMVCAQVVGNDAAVTVGGLNGNFELNVMLPVVAHNLLQSINILASAARNFADRSVSKLVVREDVIADKVGKNPILVTALNPIIGYDLAAKIAKKAHKEGTTLREAAIDLGLLTNEQFDEWVVPKNMIGSLK